MIERLDVNEAWAHSGIIKAGDFCFLNYCVGNVGGTIEEQINGAFDEMEKRLAMVGLTLEHVVQMDCLFRPRENSRTPATRPPSRTHRACRFSMKRSTVCRCSSRAWGVSRPGKLPRISSTSAIQGWIIATLPYCTCMGGLLPCFLTDTKQNTVRMNAHGALSWYTIRDSNPRHPD